MNLASWQSLFTFLLASVVVIGLAYYATRMLGTWQMGQARGRRLKVLEGVPIGRDRQLLLVAVGKEVLVLGSSQNGVSLVHRIDDPETVADFLAQTPGPAAGMSGLLGQLGQLGQLGKPGELEQHPAEAAIQANLERIRSLLTRLGGRSHD